MPNSIVISLLYQTSVKGLRQPIFIKRTLFGYRQASMTKITQLATGNGGLVYTPALGQHSASVILMHGLGDSADGMSDLAEMFTKQMPHLKFILPSAPVMSVTLNMGHRM